MTTEGLSVNSVVFGFVFSVLKDFSPGRSARSVESEKLKHGEHGDITEDTERPTCR